MMKSLKRREFVKKSAAASLGFTFVPAHLTSARAADSPLPPSERINLACVGVGGRGRPVISGLTKSGKVNVTALCDVDFNASKRGTQGTRGADKIVEQFPDAKQFSDFRVMLEKMGDDIDAVSIATPDHTHFPVAILAMSMGKHVYVEKPLAHTFRESELLIHAAKKYGVVTQMGNQGHTSGGEAQFRQLLAAGLLKNVVRMDAWKGPSLWFMNSEERISSYPKQEKMPPTINQENWDLWCGPKEVKPFSSLYHPFEWRGFYLYGGGMLGDWGCHILDFAHEHLQMGLPTRVSPKLLVDHNQVIFPESSQLEFEFPARGPELPAMTLSWKDGVDCKPQVAEKYWSKSSKGDPKPAKVGGAGSLLHNQQGDYLIARGSHASASKLIASQEMPELQEAFTAPKVSLTHQESFLEACRGNGETQSPFSVGGELTQVLNIGMISQFLNRELNFDPETKRFINDDDANALLDGPTPRKGWEDFYQLV